jgi:hypothetical protein
MIVCTISCSAGASKGRTCSAGGLTYVCCSQDMLKVYCYMASRALRKQATWMQFVMLLVMLLCRLLCYYLHPSTFVALLVVV